MRKVLKVLSLFILFGLLFFLGYVFWRYSAWYKDFNERKGKDIVCIGGNETLNEEDMGFSKRIENFILSDSYFEFITFSQKEILYLIRKSIPETESVKIDEMCLISDSGRWRLYFHTKLGSLRLPWVGIDIVKDKRETAELYSQGIFLGDMSIPHRLSKGFSSKISKGLSDALLVVTENRFLGKDIKNIDLLKDSVVFKGSL
ncbi:MAG: hypothetical protein ACOX06_01225 [Candidatus Dojkabacteria bacterium]|jgi:hypothetical protein